MRICDTLVRVKLPRDDRHRHAVGSYGHGADSLVTGLLCRR